MNRLLNFLILMLVPAFLLQGQIHVDAVPASLDHPAAGIRVPLEMEGNPDLHDTALSGDGTPLYAGYILPFDPDGILSGRWTTTDDGLNIWLLSVHVDDAQAVNVYFRDLRLSAGDRLFDYTPDRTVTLGAFTTLNNGNFMPTELIPGDRLVIEFNTTDDSGQLPFAIGDIGVSVNRIGRAYRDFGDSGPCEVLVNCPEGDEWKEQRDGVARVLVRGGNSLFWCSGSLMNNTGLDGTPYFLTANHCGENATADDYSEWVFYFNFDSADCEMPASEPVHQSLTGASLVAHSVGSTNSGSDFKLVLLNDDIPRTFGAFFNGWDWTGEPSSAGVSIHHPEGDLKMISTYDEYLVSSQYLGTAPDEAGKYWKVFWTETESGYGVTEGGSSGSPIFNEEGYVVGALAGGKASCTATTQPDYYGKFSYSLRSNGTEPERQLKPWLDPQNTGQQKLRGIYFDSTSVLADFEANTTNIKVGGLVSFKNLTEGEATSYQWYFEGGNPETSEIISPSYVEYNRAGDYDVRLIARSLKDSDTLIRKNYIHVKPTITPNPSRDRFKVSFGAGLPETLEIDVTDLQGRKVSYSAEVNKVENTVSIDLSAHVSGVYLIRINSDGKDKVLTAFLFKPPRD